MKLVFILVVTAFTICLSRELPRHRHKKMFSQMRETMLILGQSQEHSITDYSQNMGQTSDILEKLNMDWIE